MEKEIKDILAFNELGFDIEKLELKYNNDVITDIELNLDDTNIIQEGVILFHTAFGDAGSFDMLENWQRNKIYDYLKKVA